MAFFVSEKRKWLLFSLKCCNADCFKKEMDEIAMEVNLGGEMNGIIL